MGTGPDQGDDGGSAVAEADTRWAVPSFSSGPPAITCGIRSSLAFAKARSRDRFPASDRGWWSVTSGSVLGKLRGHSAEDSADLRH
jgi:hypothetical protein